MSLERVFDFLNQKTIVDCKNVSNCIEVTWEYSVALSLTRVARRTVTLDPNKNFAPIKYQEMQHNKDSNADWSTTDVVETEWSKCAGTWVPSRVVASKFEVIAKTQTETILDWHNVNTPIEKSLFSFESLGAPNGTQVVDTRLGKSIPISYIGSTGNSDKSQAGSISIRQIAIALISVIVLAVLGAIIVRYARVQRARGSA